MTVTFATVTLLQRDVLYWCHCGHVASCFQGQRYNTGYLRGKWYENNINKEQCIKKAI